MSKEKELVRNTAIITIGKICTQFLSFFLLPLYTSILTTSEYGTTDLLSTYQQLLLPIVFFQIEQALFRFLVDIRGSEKEQSRLISSAFAFVVLQSVILLAIFAVVFIFYPYEYLWNLYFYVLAVAFSSFMLQAARGLGKNTSYAVASIITALATILCNILMLVVFHLGVTGMLTSYVVGNICGGMFIMLTLRIYRRFDLKACSKKQLFECFRYCIPLIPNNLAWWVMGASDRTIVSMFMGVASNGLLSISHKFPTVYTTAFTIFNLSWTESAALHINDKDRDVFFARVINTVFNLFSCTAILIVAVMPLVFGIIVPNPAYRDALPIIPIYMLASIFNVIQGLYSVVYVGLKKTKEFAKTTIVGAVLNVIVCLALINWLGLYAAAISSVVGYGVNAIWRYIDLKKYVNAKLKIVNVLMSAGVGAAVCVCYYSGVLIVQCVGVAVAVAYALVINRQLIRRFLANPKGLIKGLLRKG